MNQPPMAIPREVVEDDPNAPDVARVAALIVSFRRTLKAFRLYTVGHPTLTAAVADFHRELGRILETESELVLRVGQGRIVYRGISVHETLDRDEGLAFRLFIHGVREISFLRDVPVEEVSELCFVLHRTLRTRTPVDDLLSLLWERDFSFINFVIIEDFLEGADRSEFDRFLADGREGDAPSTSLRATVKPVLDRLLAQATPGDGRFTTLFRISETERKRIDEFVTEERGRDLYRELAAVALPLVERSSEAEAGEIISIMVRTILSLLSEGAFKPAAGLAREIAAFLRESGSERARADVRAAIAAIDPGHVLDVVRPYLSQVRAEDLDRLAEVLSMLGPGLRPALEALFDDPEMQAAGFELMRRGGPGFLSALLARLGAPGLSTVMVLRVLSALGDRPAPDMIPALRLLVDHPEIAVRRETFRVVKRLGTEDCFPLVREALLSTDRDTRHLAIGALEGLPPASYRDALLRIIDSADFPARQYLEKRAILMALGRARDRMSEEFLLRAVRRRSFLRKHATAELRACAVAALAIRRSPTGLAEIRRAVSDPSPLVRQAASAALRAASDPA